ncbi:Putative enoyl-CoA hydratasee [Bordetella bronchiseptica MO211]|nr:Putative enoyl-CoA hydratasee [Bordetella bronchiseptica MO211]
MNTPDLAYTHWRLHREADGLAWLALARADAAANSLSAEVMAELAAVLDALQAQPPKGLVILSGKENGFIVGADINEFGALQTPQQARELVARGWQLFNRLAATPYPTLALIRGHCLGGGLELALACRYRIAADDADTALGLPEAMLGIFPGWGGMRRLPALILAARRARQGVAAKDPQGHYPAPRAIIDIWARHGGNALHAPDLIDGILASDTARQLLRVFRLQERLKGYGKAAGDAPVRRVHVVGAGVMGGDIAAWCAYRGLTVTLQDQDMARIAPALARAGAFFARKLKDRRAARAAFDRLVPDPQGDGVAQADLVIEAISENAQAKQALYRQLEPRLKPGALLATNTSSLSLAGLAQVLDQPQRLVGIHFFNPVARMPLVEVVLAADGDPRALARACAFVGRIGKLPLPVRDAPGFLVNAVLAPYMLEAMRCVDEGMAPAAIDAAMAAFGMPMGPLELADTVGLDIAAAAGAQLTGEQAPPRCLAERLARKELGRKSGRGFYAWRDGKAAVKPAARGVPPGLVNRLLQPLIDSARERVAAGVVADADLADAGAIFGTGFAPYTGGPLQYASQREAVQRP